MLVVVLVVVLFGVVQLVLYLVVFAQVTERGYFVAWFRSLLSSVVVASSFGDGVSVEPSLWSFTVGTGA